MDTFDRVVVVIMIILCSLLSGVISFGVAADFTCQQLGGMRVDNQCVQIVKNNLSLIHI